MWQEIAAQIRAATQTDFEVKHHRSVGGGSINQAYAVSDGDRAYFVKRNAASELPMFEAEARGLAEIAKTQTIKVPEPICWGVADGTAYLVLEWLDFGYGNHAAWEAMGRNLAAMHRVTSDRGFGWDIDNTIGSTPQPNSWTADWLTFYREQRLEHQFRLAQQRGGHFPQANELLDALPQLLAGHEPQPSLLHGDLWSGNAAVTQLQEPVILDPATYYGDREADLAMTELFGSFPKEFYRAYNAAWPLSHGYALRKTLYNLYHILNHFNLFGGGYATQANRMIAQLVKAC